jgi:hypothetical protein
MKKILFLLSSVAMLVGSVSAADSTNRLHFPVSGFTIAPLEAPPGDSTQQALMMFLPVSDGFAANVNVQIQPYTGTIEDYVKLSLDQFKSAGLKVVEQQTSAKSVAVFEYTGEFEGRALHWYSRAVKSGSRIYLVTATAVPSQWTTESARLKSCVDSFRREVGEQSAPAKPAPPGR